MRFSAMANIFLLEDDKILSKGISIALKKDEHTVTAVYGYLEALQQYQKQKYDLFLLDINLPDGNGLEFCKKIRETSETPVLFLTAMIRKKICWKGLAWVVMIIYQSLFLSKFYGKKYWQF